MIGFSSLKAAGKKISDVATAAGDAVQQAKDFSQAAVGIAVDTKDAVVNLAGQAKDFGQAAIDVAVDAKDTVIGIAEVAVKATSMLTTLGVIVSMVVAPVPTAIGVILFEIMTIYVYETSRGMSENLKGKQERRTTGRLLEKLAKFGAVPATALIETNMVSLRLDSVAGTASGTIKTGFFSSRSLQDLTDAELANFIVKADEETASILTAYRKFRIVQADAGPAGA